MKQCKGVSESEVVLSLKKSSKGISEGVSRDPNEAKEKNNAKTSGQNPSK